jgi:hypothetical protein
MDSQEQSNAAATYLVRVEMAERLVRSRLVHARARAARVGPMHALWEVIFDAEALLKSQHTVVAYTDRLEGLRQLADALSDQPTGRTSAEIITR